MEWDGMGWDSSGRLIENVDSTQGMVNAAVLGGRCGGESFSFMFILCKSYACLF
jgi:hypothetical protein